MPLMQSGSKKAFKKNVETEIRANPDKADRAQNLAIAYATMRKNKKAYGGPMQLAKPTMRHMGPKEDKPAPMQEQGRIDTEAVKQELHPKPMSRRERAMKAYAEGGELTAQRQTHVEQAKRNLEVGTPQPMQSMDQDTTPTRPEGSMQDAMDAAKRKTRQYAEGGPVLTNQGYQSKEAGQTNPDLADHELDETYETTRPARPENMAAANEDDRDLNQHGDREQGPTGSSTAPMSSPRADGCYADEEDGDGQDMVGRIMRMRGTMLMAQGGPVTDEPEEIDGNAGSGSVGSFNTDNYADTEDGDGQDMVGRIMAMRQQTFSEGGRVANEDHGPDDDRLAGFTDNEFDDLALRDDLESEYTGANSGDEVGNDRTDSDQEDDVARIMRTRRGKRQSNPNPA
jgi:hypothetical protein